MTEEIPGRVDDAHNTSDRFIPTLYVFSSFSKQSRSQTVLKPFSV